MAKTGSDAPARTPDSRDGWAAADHLGVHPGARKLEEGCPGVTDPAVKPTTPTLVDANNLGSCKCATSSQPGYSVYTWWVQDQQRCFIVYIPPSAPAGPLPVQLHLQCYGMDVLKAVGMAPGSALIKAADRYQLAVVGLSSPDGGWAFPNDAVINDAKPTPCASTDSKDLEYATAIFAWIETAARLDSSKIYTEG